MTSSEPEQEQVSDQIEAAMPPQQDLKAMMMAVDDIAEELSLPKFGDFINDDISPEMITAAIAEQQEAVENRMATMNKSRLKKPGPRITLPLWFHLPQGKQVIRRLMLCGRFTIPQIAQMLGLRLKQLNEYIGGMGMSQDQNRLETSAKMRKYKELTAELTSYGRMKTTMLAIRMIEEAAVEVDPETGQKIPLKIKVKDLLDINKILVANDPDEKRESLVPGGGLATSIGIGVRVTNVDRNHRIHDVEVETSETPYP